MDSSHDFRDLPAASVPSPQPARRTAPSSYTRGFSVSDLFLLVTACAVVAAAAAPVLRLLGDASRWQEIVWAILGCAFAGVIWGMILGLHRYFKGYGVPECAGIGALLGALAGPLYCLPFDAFSTAVFSSLVGSFFVLLIAFVSQRFADQEAEPSPRAKDR